jgi:hypothetical protein
VRHRKAVFIFSRLRVLSEGAISPNGCSQPFARLVIIRKLFFLVTPLSALLQQAKGKAENTKAGMQERIEFQQPFAQALSMLVL